MYYYELYVENSKNIYTYKSTIEYNIGEWCIVNFINTNRMALIVDKINEENLNIEINKIKNIIDKAPVLSIPIEIMELIKWIKNYYLSDYYNVIKTVYPGVLKLNYSKKVIYEKKLEETKEISLFMSEKENLFSKFNEYMEKKKEITLITLQKKFPKEIIEKAIKEKAITIKKQLILKKKINKEKKIKKEIINKNIILSEEQKKALKKIKENSKFLFLLKGITGSGKTEIYIKLIKEALEKNEGSIFLVPEISLTTQMIERLKEEFEGTIAILHSKLTDLEKREEWTYIRNGEKKIVIGARSAIFAPVKNLKYIIIDEEHENTYKQDNNPRYHVKNVAIKRALIEKNVKVILGSATPSFESYYQAKKGDLELIELNERYNNSQLPKYEVENLMNIMGNFSKELLTKISEVLKKREQVILILNRKAFSTQIKCRECGEIPSCPNCTISLSYYKYDNTLKCNYCGYEKKFYKKCNNCESKKLIQLGTGTEKIEEELQEYFEEAKIVRIDSESIKTKKDYEKIYEDFKKHKYDIMIGTQIIAKGFHFPNVTLVGIINSDIILNFPDFRAGEKTFQLLIQSAGRAGRGEKKGEVIIQTLNPENDVIVKTIKNDYEGYYENEMKVRKIFNYPPYGRIILIILSSKYEEKLKEKVDIFYKKLENNIRKNINIEGNEMLSFPFRAPIYKINGRYRYQIFLKFNRENIKKIKKILNVIMKENKDNDIRISVDVDPVNLM